MRSFYQGHSSPETVPRCSFVVATGSLPVQALPWQAARLRSALGRLASCPGQIPAEAFGQATGCGCHLCLVRYEGEPGLFVEGYLLLPNGPSRGEQQRPGIVALHPTTAATIDEIAGVSGRESMQLGWKLASRGFVVFCPRCFLWQDVTSYNEAVRRHRERHPRSRGMAKMLYDAETQKSGAFVTSFRSASGADRTFQAQPAHHLVAPGGFAERTATLGAAAQDG